jgi:hypothetical protein
MSTSFIDAKGLAKRIEELKAELAQLLHLESFLGTKAKGKRGRPAKAVSNGTGKTAKAPKKATGKRGALGQKITDFLVGKPKGEHVKAIATHVGTKPANITAWLYSTGKSKVKKVKPATFALKK